MSHRPGQKQPPEPAGASGRGANVTAAGTASPVCRRQTFFPPPQEVCLLPLVPSGGSFPDSFAAPSPWLHSVPGAKVVGCRGSDGPREEVARRGRCLRCFRRRRNPSVVADSRRCAPAASPHLVDWFLWCLHSLSDGWRVNRLLSAHGRFEGEPPCFAASK